MNRVAYSYKRGRERGGGESESSNPPTWNDECGPSLSKTPNVYPRYKRPLTSNDEILRLEILL